MGTGLFLLCPLPWTSDTLRKNALSPWAVGAAWSPTQSLTSWKLENESGWAGSICNEMSHFWFLGFCSVLRWGLGFSWEALGQRGASWVSDSSGFRDLCIPL